MIVRYFQLIAIYWPGFGSKQILHWKCFVLVKFALCGCILTGSFGILHSLGIIAKTQI